jgi:hypothetical protein
MLLALSIIASLSGCLPDASSPHEGGRHSRFVTSRGPVHTWCAREAAPEVLLVYVHGYFDDVDDVFREHGVLAQARVSGVNAMVVMIEAPKGPKEAVRWESFAALHEELEHRTGRPLPARVVVMGHSGGNRTLREWAKAGEVNDVVLLDAFYGQPAPWIAYLAKVPNGKLQLVGALTFGKADGWRSQLTPSLRNRVQQLPAGTDHMGVVTDGEWIPRLLQERATPSGT